MTAIPAHTELIRDFVNTADPGTGVDRLASSEAVSDWLVERGLGPVRLGRAGVARTLALRESLRRLLVANNGLGPAADADWALVEEAVRRGRIVLVRTDEEGFVPVATASGLDGALGRLAVSVARATQDGTWARLKACRAHDCQWAFFDEARNHSRQWCSMEVCGNREKVRAFRARRASA